MTDDKRPPREWWICEHENEVCGSPDDLARISPDSTPIHVVEMSALTAALKETEAWKTKCVYMGEVHDSQRFMLVAAEKERDELRTEKIGHLALIDELGSLAKDHADDWKRVQDAERKLTERDAEIAKNRKRIVEVNGFLHDANNLLARLEKALEEARMHFGSIRSGLTADINQVEARTKNLAQAAYIEVNSALSDLAKWKAGGV